MGQNTSRLGLYLPGGGSTGLITPDEPADIDKINDNMTKLDADAGAYVCTSSTRPSIPYAGKLIYETDTKYFRTWNASTSSWEFVGGSTIPVANGGTGATTVAGARTALGLGGTVLQVRSTTFAGTVAASTLAGNFTTITGLNTTITPISTLSKILVIANVNGARSTSQARVGIQLMRNSTAVGVGDAAGSRRRIGSVSFVDSVADLTMTNVSAMFLDSPATTSQVTYGVQAWNGDTSGTQTIYINRTGTDTDESVFARAASTLTLIEVAG